MSWWSSGVYDPVSLHWIFSLREETAQSIRKSRQQRGVPIVAQRLQTQLVSMRMRVQSLAPLSRLRIRLCRELWYRSQTWLWSCIAVVVVVVQAGSCSSNSTPSLETSTYHRCGPKKTERKKKKKKKKREKYFIFPPNFQMFFWVVKWLFTQSFRHFSSVISIRAKTLMIKVTETSGESFVFSHVVPIAPAHSPAAGKEKSWVKGFGWIVQTYHHNRQTAQTRGQMISPPCMRHDTSLLSYLPRSSIVLLFKKKKS